MKRLMQTSLRALLRNLFWVRAACCDHERSEVGSNPRLRVCFVALLLATAMLLAMTALLSFAQEEESSIYTDKGRRDPFIPLVDENGRYLLDSEEFCTIDELGLAGILWDPEGKSSCLINNRIVKIGDSIGGFKVTDVTKDSVMLFKNGKEYILRLSIEENKGALK